MGQFCTHSAGTFRSQPFQNQLLGKSLALQACIDNQVCVQKCLFPCKSLFTACLKDQKHGVYLRLIVGVIEGVYSLLEGLHDEKQDFRALILLDARGCCQSEGVMRLPVCTAEISTLRSSWTAGATCRVISDILGAQMTWLHIHPEP